MYQSKTILIFKSKQFLIYINLILSGKPYMHASDNIVSKLSALIRIQAICKPQEHILKPGQGHFVFDSSVILNHQNPRYVNSFYPCIFGGDICKRRDSAREMTDQSQHIGQCCQNIRWSVSVLTFKQQATKPWIFKQEAGDVWFGCKRNKPFFPHTEWMVGRLG